MSASVVGAVLLALSVALGAFGAHGLKDKLDAYAMSIYEKAVFYQFVHALGILVIPLFAKAGAISAASSTRIALVLFGGILFFSGSLYALAISGVRMLGAITPIGGLCFIVGWSMLAWSLVRGK
jgi:uncharacterized membrane protein YgdD (TMEM256/DUF423 family)